MLPVGYGQHQLQQLLAVMLTLIWTNPIVLFSNNVSVVINKEKLVSTARLKEVKERENQMQLRSSIGSWVKNQ